METKRQVKKTIKGGNVPCDDFDTKSFAFCFSLKLIWWLGYGLLLQKANRKLNARNVSPQICKTSATETQTLYLQPWLCANNPIIIMRICRKMCLVLVAPHFLSFPLPNHSIMLITHRHHTFNTLTTTHTHQYTGTSTS